MLKSLGLLGSLRTRTVIRWIDQGNCGDLFLVGKLNYNVPNKTKEEMRTVE
jgi:hypothetical protein